MTTTALVFDRVTAGFRTFASRWDQVKDAVDPRQRTYHEFRPVLRDVTFEVPQGQIVAVLGPNGAGKSTLLHLAAGLIEPSSGTVTVRGRVFGLLDLTGYFAPALSGRENVRFFHEVVLDQTTGLHEREVAVQAFADIGEAFDRPVQTYSSGMLLRLAFAAAISAAPGVLLIDEALAVGDVNFQQKCFARLRDLHARGTTILVATHAAEIIVGLCERVLLLDGGTLVFDGPVAQGLDRYYQLYLDAPSRDATDTAPDEHRYGSGDATIVRAFASIDGEHEVSSCPRGSRVRMVMDLEFHRMVAAPVVSISCATTHGVRLYATHTLLLGQHPAPGRAGERRRVELAFDLLAAVPDVFIDLAISEMHDGALVVLDARLRVARLSVTASTICQGLVDLSATYAETGTPS